MSSLPASPDAPPVGRSTWDLGLKGNGVRLDAFLKSLENVDVVDNASEVRLRRVCEAVDADVSPNGRNLVFYLSAHETRSVDFLRRVLSLGLRPDVPDSTGELPVDAALSTRSSRKPRLFRWTQRCRASSSRKPRLSSFVGLSSATMRTYAW